MKGRRRTRQQELDAIAKAVAEGRVRNVTEEAIRAEIRENELSKWPKTNLPGWSLSDALEAFDLDAARAHLNSKRKEARPQAAEG